MVVLLNVQLPDTSGLEVVRQLSENTATRQLRVTIVVGDELTMDGIKAMSLAPVFETARMVTGLVPALPMQRMFGVTSFELG